MLTLYTHPMSPCAQKVRICLAEKNLTWKAVHVDFPSKENLTPAYLKRNPAGVVPTLVDDQSVITESSVICEYLDDQYPATTLRPESSIALAQMRLWMKWVDSQLHPSCGAIQWPMVMRPKLMELTEAERVAVIAKVPETARRERQQRLVELGLDAPDVASAVATYRSTIQKMEQSLSDTSWLLGKAFTLADACLAPYFQTLYQFSWTDLFADAPAVDRWYEQCRSRDSYQQAVSNDFAPDVLAKLQTDGKAAWPKLSQHLSATV